MQGAKVVVSARNREKLEKVAEQIRAQGGEVAAFAADPVSEEQVRELVSFTVDTYGELNILCTCHGVNAPMNVLEQSVAEWEAIMDANLKSVYILAKD